MTEGPPPIVVQNPWVGLRRFTAARIALGRVGVSLPTAAHLEFQLAHARARKAVHDVLDIPALQAALRSRGFATIHLRSAVTSRAEYLQRPDKGRRLVAASREKLERAARSDAAPDLAIVIGDGLSARAIERNALGLIDLLAPALVQSGWRLAPLALVAQARVAVGDEIGEVLGAKIVIMLIGERPGLSAPDSMGIYLTFAPRIGLTDEARNCISNIRPEGLNCGEAAHKLIYLLLQARQRGLSGVSLKEDAESAASLAQQSSANFLLDGY